MAASRPHLASLRRAALAVLVLLPGACGPRLPAPSPDAAQCLAELDRRGVQYQLAPQAASAGLCAVDNPVSVTAAAIPWNQPGVVSCAFASRLERFDREVVQPAAQRYLGESVRRLRHLGTYSCRDTAGGRLSEHATGNAMDLAGFEMADGALVLVERDWRHPGPRRDFLRAVARRACGYFTEVLTPDSDRDHWNHLHLDIGPWKKCG